MEYEFSRSFFSCFDNRMKKKFNRRHKMKRNGDCYPGGWSKPFPSPDGLGEEYWSNGGVNCWPNPPPKDKDDTIH